MKTNHTKINDGKCEILFRCTGWVADKVSVWPNGEAYCTDAHENGCDNQWSAPAQRSCGHVELIDENDEYCPECGAEGEQI